MMKLPRIVLALAILNLLYLTARPAAARQDNAGDAIDAYVRERMAALGAPGAAVAVVRDGEVVHLAGYGVANPAGDRVTTVPLMLRFAPDLGLMLVIVLVLTAGWGTVRSLWAIRRRGEMAGA